VALIGNNKAILMHNARIIVTLTLVAVNILDLNLVQVQINVYFTEIITVILQMDVIICTGEAHAQTQV
jgi:hypothetical protein